ncbi:sulfurtransferase [Brachybacterium hainanense]|uniref:Sulfurtransferase n=1 Tax=Brachybacterium hainanense TaxID=1541174 RepID=A0ABV6R9Q6_9MICO
MDAQRKRPGVMRPFVDDAWLQAHRDEVVLADVRWYLDGTSGEAAYRSGHIPGAVFVDLDRWLSGDAGPAGLNPLPDPAVFARGLGGLGIGEDTAVVAYDDAGGVIAARLVWMLRAIGGSAALLDGGLAAWSGDLGTDLVRLAPQERPVIPWPAELLADADEVDAWPGLVLDARNPDRFDGSLQVPSDPLPGHIPGAVNIPCRRNLDAEGRLLSAATLRETFRRAGVEDGAEVISSCGSGVTACHTLLTLEHIGLGRGRLYPGGWSEYAAIPGRSAQR